MALVAPLEKAVDPELGELFKFFNKTLGFAPNSVLTMQRRPALARAFVALNGAVMSGTLKPGFKRLIGHVASLSAGCRYCQAHTALGAKNFGEDDDRISDVWSFETSEKFSEAERAALAFSMAAAAVPNAVDDEISARLRASWSDDEIVEILGVVALFGFLNRWNDSMGTTLEGPAESLARGAYGDDWRPGKHAAGQ